jgi:hypothetical protein
VSITSPFIIVASGGCGAPAGSPTINTGTVVAICVSASRTGEDVSIVINQAPDILHPRAD